MNDTETTDTRRNALKEVEWTAKDVSIPDEIPEMIA